MIRTFAAFWPHLRPYRRMLAVGSLLAVASIALGLAQPWPLKIVVDHVLAPVPGAEGRAPWPFRAFDSPDALLAASVASLLGIVALAALADYWSTRLMAGAGQRIGNDLRARLFAHLQRLSLRYHGENRVGDLAARVTGDVDRVQDTMVQSLAVLIPNSLLVAGMAGVMVAVDPAFAALALAASPFMAFAIHRFTHQIKAASRRARRCDGQIAAAATEHLGAIQVVQAFGLETRSQQQFGDLTRASLAASLEAARLQARFSPIVDVTAAVSTGVVLWFGARRVLDGQMTLGVLLVFLTYLGSLYKPLKAIAKLGYVASRGAASAERITAVLNETPDVADFPNARPAPAFRGRIAWHNVSFSYGRGPVLTDVDLSVDIGETLALVGPTGGGKSTVVSLIPRFADPQQGTVCVDGGDVRAYSVESLRAQIAMVLQDSVLFDGTLWDNIACGRPGASGAAVRRAATLALVDEFGDRLPDGLDTTVGERGSSLSGGQRQRVAIARALLRDVPILILDEPTSGLDAASEALVLAAITNLMRGRTTVVIAHRLSTVRGVDRVAVIDGGRVVEHGPPGQLLSAGGAYARMTSLQGLGTVDVTSADVASRVDRAGQR